MTNASAAKLPSLLIAPVRKARTIPVHDAEQFAYLLNLKENITDFALALAAATDRDKFFINNEAVLYSFLDRMEKHIHTSRPLCFKKYGLAIKDAEDLKFWNSLTEKELDVVTPLICILWAQGSVELLDTSKPKNPS